MRLYKVREDDDDVYMYECARLWCIFCTHDKMTGGSETKIMKLELIIRDFHRSDNNV